MTDLWDELKLSAQIANAVKVTTEAIYRQSLVELSTVEWQDKNSVQDLIDTGALRDNSGTDYPDAQTGVIHFDQEYASYVYEGVTYRNGTELPPKPWIDVAVSHLDVDKIFQDAIEGNI